MELPKTGDRLLGKYVLEEALGEGGMGVVYAARHDLLGERVAIKLVRPEAVQPDAITRFINEARAAARIKNEHVGRVLDVGMLESGLPYMVLEYLEGADLSRVIRERGPLPISLVADYMLQAIEAVAQAHVLGIIHRDLKPSNLFLARLQDGTTCVKVLDFGISKVLGNPQGPAASITQPNSSLGSPLYMSPEQLRDSKNVDRRCDIWGLGVIAYELLTGHVPFMADNAVALFALIQESEPASMRVSRPDVSAQLDGAVLRCLRRRVDERFSSVTELGAALAPFGGVVAARSFENAARILPFEGPRPAHQSHPSSPALRGSRPDFEAGATIPLLERPRSAPSAPNPPAALASSVADPWSRSGAAVPPKKRASLAVFVGAPILALVALASGALFIAGRARGPGDVTADAEGTASAPLVASAFATPATLATPAIRVVDGDASTQELDDPPQRAAPAVSSRSPVESKPSSPSVAESAPSPPSPATTPMQTTTNRPLAIPSATSEASAPTAPTPSAVAPSPPSCYPPYEFDSRGRKVWKRECL